MPAKLPTKGTRVPVLLSDQSLRNFEEMAAANGFSYVPQMLKQLLETLSGIDPARFHEALVAAKQAGRGPEPKPEARPVGRPRLPEHLKLPKVEGLAGRHPRD